MQNLIFRDEFPGIECIVDYLPHLGRLFTDYFEFHSRVRLKPLITFKGLPFKDRVRLYVERHSSSNTLFRAGKNGLEFDLSAGDIRYSDFEIPRRADFSGISGKFSTWLENRISKILDACEFRLVLSHQSEFNLTHDKFIAIPNFVSPDMNVTWERLKPLTFHIKVKDPQCPGLILPEGDDYLSADWEHIIPQSNDHGTLIRVVTCWYYRWLLAKMLYKVDKECVDLKKMWKRYQTDMRYQVELLNTE